MTADVKTFTIENSYLHQDDPELEYQLYEAEMTGTKHGQRKLLLALLQFVTLYCRDEYLQKPSESVQKRDYFNPQGKYLVVYAGAAHGNNIDFISKLRPDIEFYLYDPATFKIKERPGKINIFNPKFRGSLKLEFDHSEAGYFTNDEATEWGQIQKEYGNVFFVSDIRTVVEDDYEQEANIYQNDMRWQLEWCRLIQPCKAQLKFRPPFPMINNILRARRYFPYLPGTVYFGIWTGLKSTETRLVPTSYETEVLWDLQKYESQLVAYNDSRTKYSWNLQLTGTTEFVSGIPKTALRDDLDSISEIYLWDLYLSSITKNKKDTLDLIERLAAAATVALGGRSLAQVRRQTEIEFAPI